jgi:FkbM family methyltransferase
MYFDKNNIETQLCKFPQIYNFIRSLLAAKDWEKKAFIKYVQPRWVVLEIGANQGYYTSLFQKLVSPKGMVHAFEPIHSTFKLLQESVSTYPKNYYLHNLGTGAENLDSVEFHLPVNDHGQATMSPHASNTWQNQEIQKVICKVVRLDDFDPIKNLQKVNFIKLDAEGAELPSLRGAQKLLEKHKPILFFEGCKEWMKSFKYSPRDFDQFLQTSGYRHLQVIGKNLDPILSLEDFFMDKLPEASFNFLAKQT